MTFKKPIFSVLLLLSLLGLVLPTCAQVRDIGDITVQSDVKVIPVRIEADSVEIRRLAENAFACHGRYRVARNASDASFVLKFAVAGTNAIALTIQSGNPARTLFAETVGGASLRNALFRAADRAVVKTSGSPGFFAGRLTFVSERTGAKEIYISDLFFGEALQMTNDRSQSIMPRWSPDGRRILYTGYFQTGAPDIFEIDTATQQRKPFVSLKGTNTSARFSPDGNLVAMILTGEGNSEVYVSNALGRQIRRLTRTNAIEATPTWSPFSDRLVVTSDLAGRPQLFLLPVSGGSLERIPTNISGYCAEPDWNQANPDLIAFTVASGKQFQLATYSFSKKKSTVHTQGSSDAIEPCWTKDGRHLVYTKRVANNQQVHILDTETGKTTRLSPESLGSTFQANYVYP
ncbi:MAG: biopolymer transporter Tol [Opitutaceae bacterium]